MKAISRRRTQALQEEAQFENWLANRLIEDYGNVRFTDTASKAYFKWWNKDYVTGKMLIEAGFPIPGVDLAPYYAEAESSGIPIASPNKQLQKNKTHNRQL